MADTTFTAGTTIASTWLNDVNDTVYGLPVSSDVALGDALIAVKRTATAAAATTLHSWHEKQPINAIADFGCAADGVTNDTTALQAALTAAIAQKRALYIPGGTYLLTGAAGSDSFANGLLVPFGTITADPTDSVLIYGDGGLTRLKCNANNMVLLRISRNCVTVRDLVLDSNSKTGVTLCGIVPESMTQTTTQVSQSYVTLENVDRIGGAGADGITIQPGPQVGGSDSGCFYHNISGGMTSFVGGGRHVYLKKNADWASHPNRPTRTNFFGQRLVRGNTGFYLEVGSEINLYGCHEELITSGSTPLATPTARYVSADCTNINFFGGYSEGCSASFDGGANNVNSWGYIPASGSTTDWRTYVNSWADSIDDDVALTITAAGTGGTIGANTSTGRSSKNGKMVSVSIVVTYAKGTVTGPITISGLAFTPDSDWSLTGLSVTDWTGITFPANTTSLGVRVSGGGLQPVFSFSNGVGTQQLDAADLSANFVLRISGVYRAV